MRSIFFVFATLVVGIAQPAAALTAVPLLQTFSTPLFLTAPAGDSRLFIVEKGGTIQQYENGLKSTYLDISAEVNTSGERGLLGLAFDPNFASNKRFYVDYIDKSTTNTVVASFTASATPALTAATQKTIITVTQPPGRDNHKAGWIGFRSTDPGQLYIATGDGGSANDPNNNAQSLASNLGKILRITPLAAGGYTVPASNPFAGAGVAGNDEIWSFGLRNPFRNSFDRANGDFWIADVGQDAREEINLQRNGTGGGANYGWRLREGTIATPTGGVGGARPAGAVDPIFEYTHSAGGFGESIIGGYVYHGTTEPGLEGSYFFGDFVSGRIFTLSNSGGSFTATERTAELGTPFGANQLSSFGEDGLGNIYAMGVGASGKVFLIAAVAEPATWAMLLGGVVLLATFARRRRLPAAPLAVVARR